MFLHGIPFLCPYTNNRISGRAKRLAAVGKNRQFGLELAEDFPP